MVNMIKRDARLVPYLRTTIEDAGITVNVDPALQEEDYAAIKIDDYYAGLNLKRTPKTVDFIVIVDGKCDWVSMYILEFKNVNGPDKLDITDIQEKFSNTINLFVNDTFADIFNNDRFKYRRIRLYLVSDAYGAVGAYSNHAEFRAFREKINRRDTLKVDVNLSSKLYRIRGKIVKIDYDIPPNPIITRL